MRRRDFLRGVAATGAVLVAGGKVVEPFELIDDLHGWLDGRELRLMLAFGQSNMRGNVVPQGDGLIEHPRVLAYYVGDRDSLWPMTRPTSTRYTRRWATAVDPLFWGGSTAGPALTCAKDLADAWGDDMVVGIVPCAEGGKLLSYFDLSTFQYGMPMLAARNVGAVWDCCIFAHGESNASANWTQQQYADACDAWLVQYRTALGAPQLPVICSELPQTASYAGKAAINAALADWPNRDPYVKHVDSLGLASVSAHYTWDGYQALGHRLAARRLAP